MLRRRKLQKRSVTINSCRCSMEEAERSFKIQKEVQPDKPDLRGSVSTEEDDDEDDDEEREEEEEREEVTLKISSHRAGTLKTKR